VRHGRNHHIGDIEVTGSGHELSVAGHVARLLVDEGARVKKGDVLAELDRNLSGKNEIQAIAAVRGVRAKVASLLFHEHQARRAGSGGEEGTGGCLGR